MTGDRSSEIVSSAIHPRSKRPEVRTMFPKDPSNALFITRNRAQALNEWRDAACLVSTRWHMFLEAEGEGRAWAFASYVAALDAEEAAAARMAGLPTSAAA
jgi:hypothetical protein